MITRLLQLANNLLNLPAWKQVDQYGAKMPAYMMLLMPPLLPSLQAEHKKLSYTKLLSDLSLIRADVNKIIWVVTILWKCLRYTKKKVLLLLKGSGRIKGYFFCFGYGKGIRIFTMKNISEVCSN